MIERVAAAILAAEDGGSTRREDPFENITPIGQKRYRAKAVGAIRETVRAFVEETYTDLDPTFAENFLRKHGIEP